MKIDSTNIIAIEQLKIGLYVHLDLGWMDHPFKLSNFKVHDEEQIAKIKSTGLKKLRYDPKRSDCEPLPVVLAAQILPTKKVVASEVEIITTEEKPVVVSKAERLKQLHNAIDESERRFIVVSDLAKQVTRNILTSPKPSLVQATAIVNDMVDSVLTEADVAIHALNGNRSSDANYQHPLNVTILSLMLAKSIEMSKEDARILGLGALLHDIGKAEISDKILMKKDPLTKSEQSYFEQHTTIGARIAKEIGLPVGVANIILNHHEYCDGSGYPKKLKADQTDPLVKIVALVNLYDNLCNPNNITFAKTPYEALAHIYATQRAKSDESLLKRLIKSLGIYPPGSIVQLSTGFYGIVISVNPNKPLRPFVMLHDPSAKHEERLIVDLRDEPSTHISACLRPNQLPPEVFNYLNPRKRISYFIDEELLKNDDD